MSADSPLDPRVFAPLNRTQREMLRRQDLLGSQIYVIGNVTWIDGPLRADLLQRAVRDWIDAEPLLRAAVQKDADGARWVVLPELEAQMPVQDETDASGAAAQGERRVREAVARIRAEGIDPYRAPLWRFALLDLGGEHRAWITYFHHLLIDGFGIQLLWQRVRARYNRLLGGGPGEPIGPVPAFDRLAREELETRPDPRRLERDRQFWESRFAPPPRRRFPRLPAAIREFLPNLIERRWVISRSQWSALESLAMRRRVWPGQAIMALLVLHFSRLTGQRDIVAAIPLHNRIQEADQRTLGVYVSALPLRLEIEPQGSFVQAAQAFAREFRLAVGHRQYPVADLLGQQPSRAGIAGMPYDLMLSLERFDYGGSFGPARARVDAFSGHPALSPVAAYVRAHLPDAAVPIDFVVDPRASPALTGDEAFGPLLDELLASILMDDSRNANAPGR
jgi:hypothetical protein